MSERGSFVTEYMYCNECAKKMMDAFMANTESAYRLCVTQLPTGLPPPDAIYPIIAGKVSGIGFGGEKLIFMFELFAKKVLN